MVVLTDTLWQQRFQRDPGIVGSTILVSGAPHEIVGVLPAAYEPLPSSVMEAPALYKPLGRAYDATRHSARRGVGDRRAV